jgi:(5-formylfuran-3-yl)methyl phosphate synthase
MTLFLASVRDAAEAEIALEAGADIVDLKEPSRGALGAAEPSTITATVRAIAGRAASSATVGHVPMRGEIVRTRVAEIAACGVDYVKLGLLPKGDPLGCLEMLRASTLAARLIVVLFADRLPHFEAVDAASSIGAAGVMLDTAGKGGGSLVDHMRLDGLACFVATAKGHGLIVGLAGSLRKGHVRALLGLAPDFIGFRGALCRANERSSALDPSACRDIRALIPPAAHGLLAGPHIPPSAPAEALC